MPNDNGVQMTYIQAGPGAGKTRDLVGRVKALIDQGVSPYSIIPLTFCREAALTITDRLDHEVAAKTNHSFALNMGALAAKTRGEAAPRVIDDDAVKRLFERAAQETGHNKADLKDVTEKVTRMREFGGLLDDLDFVTRTITNRYFQIMKAENVVDFTGILENARREMNNPDISDYMSNQHVFVDEWQDVNPHNEWPILDKLYQTAWGFTGFGSPSQSIYSFRGARWETLRAKFPTDLIEEFKLVNYRSSPEIVRASSILAGDDAKGMIPDRPSDGIPVLWVDAITPDMELDFIGAQVSKWLKMIGPDGAPLYKPEKIAILVRTHNLLFPIQRVLRDRGLPVTLVTNKFNPFHRIESQALLGYLRLADDPMDDSMLESIIDYPPAGIGLRRRFQMRGDGQLEWDHLLVALANSEEFPEQVIERVLRLLDVREHLDHLNQSKIGVKDRITRAIDLTGISSQLLADGDYNGMKALTDLANASSEFISIREFIEYFEKELDKPRELAGVKLGTLHASKGLEWEAVILPNLQEGVLPMAGGDKTEEGNLAFVGVSRAKQRLVLTSNAGTPQSPIIQAIAQESIKWPRKRL